MSKFYQNGLKFSCKECGYCCREEPGYVFLSNNDLQNLQTYFSLSRTALIETYCRVVEMGNFKMLSLKENMSNDCILLSNNGCQVYAARPLQCRSYPFWASLMDDRDIWIEEGKSCPGIGQGKLYSADEIEQWIYLRRRENPIQF
ncbi:MAG: YkgJ family cysteine cluster protein [Spirochaetia bacterium]|nr:YkgJ family cysteine cluster protein [Spirochaetia bacterium]